MHCTSIKMNRLVYLVTAVVLISCYVGEVSGQRRRSQSNCAVGGACDKCPVGEYRELQVGSRRLKVCCPHCGTYLRAGYIRDDKTKPYCVCDQVNSIRGDCWKGEQCETCLAGANSSYVGRINSIPVCCAACERSGMALGSRLCNCLHNGP